MSLSFNEAAGIPRGRQLLCAPCNWSKNALQ